MYSAGRPTTEPISEALKPRSPVGFGIGVTMLTISAMVASTAAT